MEEDLEDGVILEDIKALQGVLAQKERVASPASEVTQRVDILKPNQIKAIRDDDTHTDSYDESDSDVSSDDEIDDIKELGTPQTALDLNRKLVNRLLAARKKFANLLEQCRKNQKLVDEKILRSSTVANSRVVVCTAGMPYFKDKQYFPAPKNEDAKTKDARGELLLVDLPRVFRWTPKDRTLLVKSIRKYAAEILVDELEQKELRDRQQQSKTPALVTFRFDSEVRSQKVGELMLINLKDLVGPLGTREFDWLKMTTMDFQGRHSASECRVMWNVFLHPDINKCRWSRDEDTKLRDVVQKHDFQNWDTIAKELDTKRTGYQCFIRYKTHNKNTSITCAAWSKEEDQKLLDWVKKLRVGDFIPWGEVAISLKNRTKQQVYFRWWYSLAPHLKKGRFTKEEDKTLLDAVSKYGKNFGKISAILMPHRTSAQLNDHYQTLIAERLNLWSIKDDTKLINLHRTIGNDWVKIAKEFPNKSRVQVRHRYGAILRYEAKGVPLNKIPRLVSSDATSDSPTVSTSGQQFISTFKREDRFDPAKKTSSVNTQRNLSAVDKELRDYFKGLHHIPSKPGRIKKCYDPDELDKKTQKLYVILQILGANLVIPDHLGDESRLTEKDKQLLTSLKEFSKTKIKEATVPIDIVESTRLKMFGTIELSTNDHFVPPLPFGIQTKKCMRKQTKSIDYSIDMSKNFLVDIEWKLETPDFVISLIGGSDEEMQFRKINGMFVGENHKSEQVIDVNSPFQLSTDRKDYSPKWLHKKSMLNDKKSEKIQGKQISTINLNLPSTSSTQPNTSRQRNTIQQVAADDQQKTRRLTLIPPNFTTLLGFRSILFAKHMLESKDSSDSECEDVETTVTTEGLKAFELYEERLTKLFKFPVEMSETPPPFICEKESPFVDQVQKRPNSNLKRKRSRVGHNKSKEKETKLAKIENANVTEK